MGLRKNQTKHDVKENKWVNYRITDECIVDVEKYKRYKSTCNKYYIETILTM